MDDIRCSPQGRGSPWTGAVGGGPGGRVDLASGGEGEVAALRAEICRLEEMLDACPWASAIAADTDNGASSSSGGKSGGGGVDTGSSTGVGVGVGVVDRLAAVLREQGQTADQEACREMRVSDEGSLTTHPAGPYLPYLTLRPCNTSFRSTHSPPPPNCYTLHPPSSLCTPLLHCYPSQEKVEVLQHTLSLANAEAQGLRATTDDLETAVREAREEVSECGQGLVSGVVMTRARFRLSGQGLDLGCQDKG